MTIAEKLLRAKTDYDEVYDAGYDEGVTSVKIEEAKSSADLTVSGTTVTVPAGYYAEDAEKSVAAVTQATPIITVNSSGLITASTTQAAGYVNAGYKENTKQLTTQGAKTVIPSATSSTLAVQSGRYTTGPVTVPQEPNMIPQNIKKGVSIYGVEGTFDNYEVGRKNWIPLAAQNGKSTISVPGYYSGDVMYSPDVFEGEATEYFTLETMPYSLSDWIQVAVAASESASCIISGSNAHRSLYFILYIEAELELDDFTEYIKRRLIIPPASTASVEFDAHDHDSQGWMWSYTIEGVRVSKDGT